MINKEALDSFKQRWHSFTQDDQDKIIDELVKIWVKEINNEVNKEIMEEILFDLQGDGFIKPGSLVEPH